MLSVAHRKFRQRSRSERARLLHRKDLGQPFFLPFSGWSGKDAVGLTVAVFAVTAILINALFLQTGPHPVPIFKSAGLEPTPRTFPISPRTLGDITMDIQRELARRGFYDGSVNGLYGPKTHAAIRDFEHAAGLKPSMQPNEALLQAILRFPAKADKSSR
jgi:hypothetical protein